MNNKIACIQMASGPNVQGNLQEARRLVTEAAAAGAAMVVLPETFAFMGMKITEQLEQAEDLGDGDIQRAVASWARELGVWIVAGTIPVKSLHDKTHVRAACLLFNDQGEQVARYDKIHLFDVELPDSQESYHESSVFESGDEVVVAETPLGRVGLAVCYDLRFPELFRTQLDMGMELLVVPAAFTKETGKAHWHALLKARAIENLCYVAAAAQGGYHANGRQTYGHSLVLSPWGQVQEELPTGAGFVMAEVDLEKQRKYRQSFPVLQHRRLSCRIS